MAKRGRGMKGHLSIMQYSQSQAKRRESNTEVVNDRTDEILSPDQSVDITSNKESFSVRPKIPAHLAGVKEGMQRAKTLGEAISSGPIDAPFNPTQLSEAAREAGKYLENNSIHEGDAEFLAFSQEHGISPLAAKIVHDPRLNALKEEGMFLEYEQKYGFEKCRKAIKEVHAYIYRERDKQIEAAKIASKEKAKAQYLEAMYKCMNEEVPDSPRLQKNEHTRLHRLYEAADNGELLDVDGSLLAITKEMRELVRSFVVKHDWAEALGDSLKEAGQDIRLPFPECAFEFMTEGYCVILVARQIDGEKPSVRMFIESHGQKWVAGNPDLSLANTIAVCLWRQVVAICVTLDAQVTIHEVVRAPSALNKKREKNGKPPIKDHYVIDLSRRHRAARTESLGTHRSPRLHFRRGHWRHFDSGTKTWINWMLVGNPDFGFVDKHYKI